MKRKPLLADLFLADTQNAKWFPDKVLAHVRSSLFEAKRFVFDNDSAAYFGEIVRDYPVLAATSNEFAIQPFPVMHIEIPYAPFFTVVNGFNPDADADEKVAYLYTGTTVYTLAQAEGRASLMPVKVKLNSTWTPNPEEDIADLLQVSRLGLDAVMWGSSYNSISQEYRKALRHQHAMQWCGNKNLRVPPNLLEVLAGDLRNIILLLLFLNQTRDTIIEEKIPPMQGMLHNKAKTYVSHSVVKLNMHPKKRFVKLLGHGGAWRKEHGVRGHFCRDKKARESNCVHDWQEAVKAKDRRWFCSRCSGLMWWRKDHRRGHKEKGIVRTDYEVIA